MSAGPFYEVTRCDPYCDGWAGCSQPYTAGPDELTPEELSEWASIWIPASVEDAERIVFARAYADPDAFREQCAAALEANGYPGPAESVRFFTAPSTWTTLEMVADNIRRKHPDTEANALLHVRALAAAEGINID